MKALYRRYRPRSLKEVIGQSQVTDVLKRSLENHKINHAYLFIGPRGTGKTSVARIFAHEINGFDYELEDDYIDIVEIDAASNTGVDNIRDLREKAIVAPSTGQYKVYIIDEVHMLSKGAFNALLKILEEPPAHVVFIMATTDAYKVPITISSRCQTFTFKLATPEIMLDYLKEIVKKEKINIDSDALQLVVQRGGGSFRDTLSLLDQVSNLSDSSDKPITLELLTNALGLPQQDAIDSLLAAYQSASLDSIRTNLNTLYAANIKPDHIAAALIDTILANPNPSLIQLLSPLVAVSSSSQHPDAQLLVALCSNQTSPTPSTPTKATPQPPQPSPSLPRPAVPPSHPSPATTPTKPVTATAPTTAPTKPVAATAPTTAAPQSTTAGDSSTDDLWQTLLSHAANKAKSIYSTLNTADHDFANNTLTIYIPHKFKKQQVEKKRAVLCDALPSNVELAIVDHARTTDPTIASIAEIMGGGEEVALNV
ncbi:DNA polymerase III subunit gamma/tau [Candidatus Saccharibacteria bacterium]|nr:DNA polymerase III subunit gamma/tau [Candidatus Saccharibacteria bacterium]